MRKPHNLPTLSRCSTGHPERSEGSRPKILRCAWNDRVEVRCRHFSNILPRGGAASKETARGSGNLWQIPGRHLTKRKVAAKIDEIEPGLDRSIICAEHPTAEERAGDYRHDAARARVSCHQSAAPDRTPADYKAEPEVNRYMMEHLKVDSYEDLLRRLEVDVRRLEPRYVGPPFKTFEDGVFEDYWGIRSKHLKADHGSYDMHVHTPVWDAQVGGGSGEARLALARHLRLLGHARAVRPLRGLRRHLRGGRPVHAAVHSPQHGERDARHGRAARDGALPDRQVYRLLLRGHHAGPWRRPRGASTFTANGAISARSAAC